MDDIDPTLCTHYIYGFAKLNDETCDSIEILDPTADITNKGYEKFVALKEKNTNIKTMIAIGGWTDSESGKYSILAADSTKIANFVQSVVQFLETHKFDGLDVDWEFPYQVRFEVTSLSEIMKPLIAHLN